jgi:CPA1 family monovalent cation:H+ antiporter
MPLMAGGAPFPDRDLVLAVTFIVISVTLIGLGAALPAMIRLLGLARSGADEAEAMWRSEQVVRLESVDQILQQLSKAEDDGAPPAAIAAFRKQHEHRRSRIAQPCSADSRQATRLHLALIEAERQTINKAYLEDRLSDEARRRIERELDLEFARLNQEEEEALLPDRAT